MRRSWQQQCMDSACAQGNRKAGLTPEPEAAGTFKVCSQVIRPASGHLGHYTENSEGFGFSCVRQDEFLPQSVLQTEVVFLLGRKTTVPGIHFVHEFNMEIHE